jgi:hypothetical protein
MRWSLNHVLKATVRGARDSRVSLLTGLAGTKLDRRRPRRSARLQPTSVSGASGARTFSSVPGAPRQGAWITLMEVRLSRVKHRMPARWRASCRLEGRQVWLVRDARSDSYTRVHGLATVSAGPVFVVRALLSKIERGQPGAGCSCLDRGCSRAGPGACRLFSRRGAWVGVRRRSRAPSRTR